MRQMTARSGGAAARNFHQTTQSIWRRADEQENHASASADHAASPLAGLHRTVGNQAVAQMVRSHLPAAASAPAQRRTSSAGMAAGAPAVSHAQPRTEQAAAQTAQSMGSIREADELGATPMVQAKSYAGSPGGEIRRFTSIGQPVVQRQLFSYPRRGGGVEETRPDVGDLGVANNIFNDYAQFLKDDSSAIVKGRERDGNPGLVKVLKEAEVDIGEVRARFIAGLIANKEWKKYNNFDGLRTKISESDTYAGTVDVDDMNNKDLIEFIESDDEIVEAWLKDIVTFAGDNVWAVITAVAGMPDDWKSYMSMVLYEEVKNEFYDQNEVAAAYVQPFIQLITDVNSGAITQLDFVEKYGAPGNRGAEFEVAAPADKQALYANTAVVHTHYGADDEQPNYGHTKPYHRRLSPGYGYTVVNVGRLNAMDDTQKTWDEL